MDDILKILKENARQSVDFIAAQVKSTGEAVAAQIKEYEEKGVIRGQASEGMLCSERELLISEEHNGIIEVEGM